MREKIKEVIEGRRWWVPFVVLLLIFTALRCLHINYDAPQDLSISAALYTDEGLKTFSPANYVQHGNWKWTPEDEYSAWFERAIIPTYLHLAVFKIFGVSFVSAKIVPITLAFFSMILIFFMVKQYYNIYTAYVAFILFGLNHFVLMYNRLAFYENFLLFFSLVALYGFTEFYRRLDNLRHAPDELHHSVPVEVAITALCLLIGCGGIVCGYFSKESMNIIIVSIVPFAVLYFFYMRFKLTSFVIHAFYLIIIAVFVFYMTAAHTGWFDEWFKSISGVTIFNISLGKLLPLKTNVGNFDPIYLSFAKSLFLEFIYNQPFVFFTGIFFAIMCFYRFLYQSRCNLLDMILSSWLLFCFIFLTIMKYHPARYYLLISVPLIILSARFIVSRDFINIAVLTKRAKTLSFFSITSIFWFYFVFYAGVIFFVFAFPFTYRKRLYDFAYKCFTTNTIDDLIPIALLIIAIQVFFFLLIVPKIRPLKNNLEKKKFFTAIFLLAISFDVFLYCRWFFTGRDKLYAASVKIGQALPQNAILAGGWAPGLAMENGLRSIVLQGELSYNTGLVSKLLSGESIPVSKKINGKTVSENESRMPIYLIVSENTTFDSKMLSVYKPFIKEHRLVDSFRFGYSSISIYRLDRRPEMEKKKLQGAK